MRAFSAALFLCLLIAGVFVSSDAQARVHRDLSREFTSEGRWSGGGSKIEGRTVYRSKKRKVHRSVKRDRARTMVSEPRGTISGYAEHIRSSARLSDLVSPLAVKVSEINRVCGSQLISAYRPGARVRGSGRASLHSSYPSRAADLKGNPGCIARMARGWPGGMSTDYGRVKHYHLSYEPGGREWGARFAHAGGRKYRRHRYAVAQ